MAELRKFLVLTAATLFCAVMLPGCASVSRRVDILYHPSAYARGGGGDLYLVKGSQTDDTTAASQWIIGEITTKDGEKINDVVTDIAPDDLVADALSQELKAAGYNVITTDNLPPDATKAVTLNSVAIKLDEEHSVMKDDATCSLKISVQPWRNGTARNTLGYKADYAETAITNRDLLLSKALKESLKLLMKYSIPEIVRSIEQQQMSGIWP